MSLSARERRIVRSAHRRFGAWRGRRFDVDIDAVSEFDGGFLYTSKSEHRRTAATARLTPQPDS